MERDTADAAPSDITTGDLREPDPGH